jgi:predicted RecB family endonuclease
MLINKEKLQEAVTKLSEKLGVKLNDVFVSYHVQSKPRRSIWKKRDEEEIIEQGFGNMVTKFPLELYRENIGKFIEDLQKAIEMSLKLMYKKEYEVKILFFR